MIAAIETETEDLKDINPINIKFTAENGINVPSYKTEGSSGLDIEAFENAIIPAGGWAAVGTGIFVEIPSGYEIQVRSRSGLALKNGIFVLNSPGTIDSDYRGEIKIILANLSKEDFTVKKGDRIAQLVPAQVCTAVFSNSLEISDTIRGAGGFGHTGINSGQN